jgi:hypothetical protein
MNRRPAPGRAFLIWAPLALLLALRVHAAPTDEEFQRHYRAAIDLFLSERYPEALKEFQAAYEVRQLPRLLINIGTAHRKLGHAREAIEAYQAYLRIEPHPEPEVQAKLKQCLEQAHALLEMQRASEGSPTASSATGQPGSSSGAARRQRGAAGERATARGRSGSAPDTGKGGAASPFVAVDHPARGDIQALTGAGTDDLWMVERNNIHHLGGGQWSVSYRPWNRTLQQVWGTPDGKLWAVGKRGMLLHFDGKRWFEVESGIAGHLIGVWGTSATEVWTMDATGAIYHLEGTDWLEVPTERSEGLALEGCYAVRPDLVYAVGAGGKALRWDGKTVTELVTGVTGDLHGVWASRAEDVWAVGDEGRILRFDGKRWTQTPSGLSDRVLFGVWGSAPDDVWAVGGALEFVNAAENLEGQNGTVLHWNGRAWSVEVPSAKAALVSVWGSGPKDVYAAGTGGAVLRYDGQTWSELPRRTSKTWWHVWGRSPSDVWAVGERGSVLRFDGRRWSSSYSRPSDDLTGLYRVGPRDVWAVGMAGSVLHYDGTGWMRAESGTLHDLQAVWASGPDDVYAVGERGTIVHFDGVRWTTMKSGSERKLLAVWGSGPKDVWVAGQATLLHGDGKEWTPVTIAEVTDLGPGRTWPLRGVWGSGPGDVWVAGNDALLLHFDGQMWKRVDLKMKPAQHLGAVAGSGPRDVWVMAAGSNYYPVQPSAFHFDGKAWSSVPLPRFLTALWVGGPGNVWGAGESATLVRLPGR